MTRNLLRAGALSCALMTSTCLTAPAWAQSLPSYRSVDANGVDLTHGDIALTFTDAVIGSGPGALSLTRVAGNHYRPYEWDRMQLRRLANGAGVDFESARIRERFTGPDNAMTSTLGNGSTLAAVDYGNQYLLTRADGTRIRFGRPLVSGGSNTYCSGTMDLAQGCTLVPLSITSPDGSQLNLVWDAMVVSEGSDPTASANHVHHLAEISNSYGYKVVFSYANDFFVKSSAELRNEHAANPVIGTISYSSPNLTTTDVTDMAGRTWRITGGADILGIRAPGQASDSISVTRSGLQVTSVTNHGVTTSYSRTVSSNIATMTVTDANNQQSVIVSDLTTGRPTSIKDPLNRTMSYQYDGAGRVTRVTAPEGNYTQYSYDGRGNVTQVSQVGKPTSGVATITTSAAYASTCSNPVICNLPTSTTDARGNVTDYTYDPTHGGVLTVTAPAPTAGAARPQTRYAYTLTHGEYQLTDVSACASGTAPGCVGSAAESRTVIGYDVNGNATSVQQRDGTGQLSAVQTMTYTAMGDVASVDGPLAGTADTTRIRYNAAHEQVGVISPDPDGAGPLQHRAMRNIIDASGLVTRVDAGTVASQSDADWANMAVYQSVGTDYDQHRRPVVQRLTSGGTTYSLAQTSYDALGRPECTAQRMNPAAFGSLPASACSLGAEGTFGPDRIAKTVFDAAGQVTRVESGVGTAAQANEMVATYRPNGQAETLTDGENNRTTFAFDGHDRLQRTYFPVATKGAGQSNGGDYEELGYDPAGNVTSRRVRDGNVIGFSYDALDRPTFKNLPGTEPDVSYGYDLLGQLTSASTASQNLSFTYDALGRQRTEAGPLGTVQSHYDAGGRRTSLSYPDGFVLHYSYLNTGEMQAIDQPTGGAFDPPENLITFGYDSMGRRTSLNRANGTSTSYGYDAAGRLASLSHDMAGTTRDVTFGYGYNPASQIASRTTSNDAYAAAVTNANQSDSHNGLNQIVTANGTTVSHDAKGNMTSDPSVPMTYGYSSENLLTSAPGPYGSGTLNYDPLMRLWDSGTGGRTRVLHDGEQRIAEFNVAGTPASRFVFGPGIDEPLIRYTGSDLANRQFLHADERGSIVGGTDAAGNSLGVGTYDDYGRAISWAVGRFGYAGQPYETVSDLQYSRGRFYNPRRERFMQLDPTWPDDGANGYGYVGGDPINFVDPLGLQREEEASDGFDVVGWRLRFSGGAGGGGFWGGGGRGGAFTSQPAQGEEPEFVVTGKRIQRPGLSGSPQLKFAAATQPGITDCWTQGSTWLECIAGAGLDLSPHGRGAKIIWRVIRNLARPCGCFEAGTLVATPSGLVPIEQIKVGDLVLSMNEATGEVGPQRVTALIRPDPKPLYSVRLNEADGEEEIFHATDDHPWRVNDRGWVETANLLPGDRIDTAGKEDLTVRSLEMTSRVEAPYSLTVENWHTFLVGEDEVVVHNACPSPNQLNQKIQSGQAPRGIFRVDVGKVKGEQTHVHVNGGALNRDGTWKHQPGSPLTRGQRDWLKNNGWELP